MQAAADVESRALLALIVISLQLDEVGKLENARCVVHLFPLRLSNVSFKQTRFMFQHGHCDATCASCLVYVALHGRCLPRYPVLWLGVAEAVGALATSICIVVTSILAASIAYAVLRFDQMHQAILELELASEAVCSQVKWSNIAKHILTFSQ